MHSAKDIFDFDNYLKMFPLDDKLFMDEMVKNTMVNVYCNING